MWPAWQVPPKYITVMYIERRGFQVMAGDLVVHEELFEYRLKVWLDGNGYVSVAPNLFERSEKHVA